MSNGPAHAIGAAVVVGGAHLFFESRADQQTLRPVASGLVAGALGSIPDWLEPAVHPNHRQFCHSLTVAVSIAYGACKLYAWRPEEPAEQLLRWLMLVAAGSYLVHLAMDSRTSKSIPLLGRLS